jgi:hypothetical protein
MYARGVARTAALVVASFIASAEARTITVNCNEGHTINGRLLFALPGDTLLVTGVCNEHVVIREHKVEVRLEGQGSAEIHAPENTRPAIAVRGRGTEIRGFRIIGGRHGISVQDGGYAVIDGNIIENAAENGITVSGHSWAGIVNNTVRGNAGDGITVNDNSSARIGFLDGQAAAPSPNFVDGNGRGGVTVNRSANARIAGNSFTANLDYAVRVVRGAQADVAANAMNSNLGGIFASQNSTVNLADGGDLAGSFLSSPNSGLNSDFGVRCREAAVIRGTIAPLTGARGPLRAESGCANFSEVATLP